MPVSWQNKNRLPSYIFFENSNTKKAIDKPFMRLKEKIKIDTITIYNLDGEILNIEIVKEVIESDANNNEKTE